MVKFPAGVRIEFATDSRTLEVEAMLTQLEVPYRPPGDGRFDLVINGGECRTEGSPAGTKIRTDFLTFEVIPGPVSKLRFAGLPAGEKTCELWLPSSASVELRALRIDDGVTIAAPPPEVRPRWIHHGSSISQCSEAASPTLTWPAVAARLGGVDLLNLGFGGNCHLDSFVARTMRDEPGDVLSLKADINVWNFDSLKDRTFAPALHCFIDTVRDGKPETPFLVASPVLCPGGEDKPGPSIWDDGKFIALPEPDERRMGGLTISRMREIIRDVVAQRRQAGDTNLHYLDGLELFGPDDASDLPDDLHPNAAGYVRIGERFAKHAFGPGKPLGT